MSSDATRCFFFIVLSVLHFSSWAEAESLQLPKAPQSAWEPVVHLRDATDHFKGTPDRPKPVDGWWVTPIHATLLSDGRVLISGWGRFDRTNCRIHRTRQNGESFLLDPRDFTGGVERDYFLNPIDESPREGSSDVLYCAGNVTLPNGKVLMVGGARYENLGEKPGEQEYGLNYFRIFDPLTNRFSHHEFAPQGSPKKEAGMDWYEPGMMWYPTETRLPDGKVLVAGGFDRNCGDATCMNRDLEIFDSRLFEQGLDPWKTWLPHELAPTTYDPGIKDYTHSFLLYKSVAAKGFERELVLMGWQGVTALLSLDERVASENRLYVPDAASDFHPSRPGSAQAWDSSAALVGTGEIMVVGGGADPQREAQRIDLYNPLTGKWRQKDMGITRHNPATTLLPDGTVLIVNGEPGDDPKFLGDRRQAQIYDPFTDALTTLPAWPDLNSQERGYHSFSLLLKDGRVLMGGGMVTLAQVGCERPDLRIFNPPYLFKGAQPVIEWISDFKKKSYGESFRLRWSGSAPRKERGVVLMALGSETHSFDQNQRYIPLKFETINKNRVRVFWPEEPQQAPQGEYLLFLVDDRGRPSAGASVQLF